MTTTKKTGSKQSRKLEPDLAEMIVAVMEHPDCPPEIQAGISSATSQLFNRLNEGDGCVYETAPYIRALIFEHIAQEGDAN